MIDACLLPQLLLFAELLSVDYSLAVIIVLFIVLAVLLNSLIFNPILKVLEERERLTSGSISGARHLLDEYDRRLKDYESALKDARLAAYEQMEKHRSAAMKERTDMLNTVRTETTANIAKAKSEIEAQVKQARTTLEKDASVMAATISTSILGRQVGGPR